MQYFPDNSLTSFKTKLAKPIIHDGNQWEVALVELSFPKSWLNVTEGENEIYVENNNQIRCLNIPLKRYSNNFEFYQALKECFTKNIPLGIHVRYTERTGHIVFEINKDSLIYLSGKLALQVGFENDVVLCSAVPAQSSLLMRHRNIFVQGRKISPPNPVNVNFGYDILFVYTDCIEQQLVGDVQAQLLRNICINNINSNAMQTVSFEQPHYVTVSKRHFDTIKLDLRDETGKKLPFQFGRVVVKLHFRAKKHTIFQ